MPLDYISSEAQQTDQRRTLRANLKHVLGDSTNTSSEHGSSRASLEDRIRRLQKAAVIRQYQQETLCELQLIEDSSDSKRIKIDTDIVDEITRYQQGSTDRQTAKSRRELSFQSKRVANWIVLSDQHHLIIIFKQGMRSSRANTASINASNPNRYEMPRLNSALALETMSDEEIARQQQANFYETEPMDVSEQVEYIRIPFNLRQRVDIDADAAYARELQQEEYSRQTLDPSRSYRGSSTTKRTPSHAASIRSDAQLAEHLQAEENQRGRRHQQRPNHYARRQQSARLEPNEPDIISIPRLIERPTVRRPARSNDPASNIANLFSSIAAASGQRLPGRRNHDTQGTADDFGPDDYERLLDLDKNVPTKKLTSEQINILPTEVFQGAKNKNDEENKCSVCWDDFEQSQTLRRLRCFHLYHKECIDKWLKDKNQCPICRIPPIV
ncbi:unnamed protein product [Adineta ricciae]|uniref:RING-type domain-containing protein n=1 Tax=Adineta ricciae TaxID=249248 RepID=A0A813VT19_ADIRI|nr:unnamed protein product [Adineta ricciae]